jgi:hypothetical protein
LVVRAAFPGGFGTGFRADARVEPLSDAERTWLKSARRLAWVLDAQFSVLGFRFGLDPIIGVIPWVGDIALAGASLYMMVVGAKLGLPRHKLAQMGLNAMADVLLGVIPIAGHIADAVFKAHLRNLQIIEDHIRDAEQLIDGDQLRR